MRWIWIAALLIAAGCLRPSDVDLTIGTTTTTQDSGLLDVLLPGLELDTGLRPHAVVGGTGEIIEKARHGDVDVLFTHSPTREAGLVQEGLALRRAPVMFNRFVVAGPAEDPAGITRASNASEALRRIHDNRSAFFSRGDQSGTHDKEVALWKAIGLDPSKFDHAWYKETGTGQGATLAVASEFGGYVLLDEGTLLQFHESGKASNIVALFAKGAVLRNQYAVTELDPDGVPVPIRSAEARRFAQWITGPQGQVRIASYRIAGEVVFTPNANETGA